VISNSLYIFAPDSIYIFRGYDYETFALNQIVMDFGIKEHPTHPKQWLTTVNNMAYFYNNGDIYEFDGDGYPRLITHSLYVNGKIANGIMGGVQSFTTDYLLASDNEKLYVYLGTTLLHTSNIVYSYYSKTQTWWKQTGYTKNNSVYSTTAFNVRYIQTAGKDTVVAFVSVDSTAGSFDMHYAIGHKNADVPFIITKAFNANPTDMETLTSIHLLISGAAFTTGDITVSFSLSTTDDDFTVIQRYTDYPFTGNVEVMNVILPYQYIANVHHYRIKVEIEGTVYLYNIERRFRVRGRRR
jgi:hypothetical protein